VKQRSHARFCFSKRFWVLTLSVLGSLLSATVSFAQGPQITSTSPLPDATAGTAYSFTFMASGGTTPYMWSVSGTPVFSIASTSGVLTGTPTQTGTFTFSVTVTDSMSRTATKPFSIDVTPLVTTTSLPDGRVGTTYAAPALTAKGGTSPYHWSIVSGALPAGLNPLSDSGVISGIPTVSGVFTFTVRVTDSATPSQRNDKTLTLKIPPQITTTSLPNGRINAAYSQTLAAAPSTDTPLTWSCSATCSTVLPPGLSLSFSSGVISGTPTTAGTYNFTVILTDNSSQTDSKALSITIQPLLTIPTASLPNGIASVFYAQQLMATGPSPLTWTVLSGILPPGLSLGSNGLLNGTPNTPSTFNFTVQATGGDPQQTAQQSFSIVILPALTITTTTLPGATLNTAYPSTPLLATGGRSPYTWANIGAALPAGMSLSAGGVLSGTPTTPGNVSITVQVTDAADSFIPAQTATRSLQLTVANTLTITTPSFPNGSVGTPYSQTLSAAAGTPPFVWSFTGNLPPGLTLSSTGTISGIPTSAGPWNFTISLTDSSIPTQSTTKNFILTIIQPTLTITTSSPLPPGIVSGFYLQQLTATGPTPQNWSVFSGVLPPGLTITPSGTISGTPTANGEFDFTIQVTGGTGGSDPIQTATKAFHLTINAALSITTATLPAATLSTPYANTTLTATGGLPPYTWTALSALPPGMSLSSSGVFSGTPTSPGTFQFIVQVSDSFNPTQQVSHTFTLVVNTTVTITTTSLPNAIQNSAYSQQLQALGTSPYLWAVTNGVLPAGLTLTSAGVLQGTPTTTDSQTFTVTVTDARGATGSQVFRLTVTPPLPGLSLTSVPASLSPTQQSDIGFSLVQPYPGALSGQLVMSFSSKAEVPADDPATQFSTGSRSVAFTIPANTTAAVFTSRVVLLAGTVVGTVTLTANFDNGPSSVPVGTVEIAPTPPQITNITATRTLTGLDIQITGYAPSRRITTVEFSFDVKNGSRIDKVPLSKDVDADFRNWYTSQGSVQFGSAFSFVQSFHVTGDATAIQSVTVRLTNAQGSTSSSTVRLQ